MDIFEDQCRVCQCKPGDKTMVALSKEQMGKLKLIGDCSNRVHFEGQSPSICIECESNLDVVNDFVRSCKRLDVNGPGEAVEAGLPKTKSLSRPLSEGTSSDVTKKDCGTQTIESFLSRSSGQLNSSIEGLRTTKHSPLRMTPIKSFESDAHPQTESATSTDSETNQLVDSGSSFRPNSNGKLEYQRDSMKKSDKECYLCGKQFSTKVNMVRHVRVHLGRRFVCEYKNCYSFFTTRSALKTHNLIHKGLKPFVCDSCNKRFTQWKSLRFHERTHTGEKPFTCDYCQAPFNEKSNLVRHFRTIKPCWNKLQTRSTKFQCQQCSKYLASKQSLLRHQHTQHERMTEQITSN